MNRRHQRLTLLHGVLVILTGMMIAGFPLTAIVMRDSYHMPVAASLPGDYRGWMMAHFEGVLNGLLTMALALAAELQPLSERRSTVLLWALAAMGWSNVIASVMAPILGVRGMAYDGNPANNLVTGVFGVAFAGTLVAFYIVVRALAAKVPQD